MITRRYAQILPLLLLLMLPETAHADHYGDIVIYGITAITSPLEITALVSTGYYVVSAKPEPTGWIVYNTIIGVAAIGWGASVLAISEGEYLEVSVPYIGFGVGQLGYALYSMGAPDSSAATPAPGVHLVPAPGGLALVGSF